jgi:hypothetical protein
VQIPFLTTTALPFLSDKTVVLGVWVKPEAPFWFSANPNQSYRGKSARE